MLKDLAKYLEGRVYFSRDKEYKSTNTIFNGDISINPKCVIYPNNINDIQFIVNWSREKNLNISVRNGGHMPSGIALNNDVVIDMRLLNSIYLTVDSILVVEAGALNQKVHDFLDIHQIMLPIGISGLVGITGFTLGGGIGIFSKKYGLLCDLLVEVEMILPNGKIIVVNQSSYADLFWALKGAGNNNFGVVTKMKFKTFPALHKVYQINVKFHLDDKIFNKYLQYSLNLDNNTTTYFIMLHDHINIIVYSIGTQKQIEIIYNDLLSFGQILHIKKERLTVKELQMNFDASFNHQVKTIWKSKVIKGAISNQIVNLLFKYISFSPNNLVRITLDLIEGEIKNTFDKSAAFPYRDYDYILSIKQVWNKNTVRKKCELWINSIMNELDKLTEDRVFANYHDKSKPPETFFGAHTLRLAALKKKYDPQKMFIGTI